PTGREDDLDRDSVACFEWDDSGEPIPLALSVRGLSNSVDLKRARRPEVEGDLLGRPLVIDPRPGLDRGPEHVLQVQGRAERKRAGILAPCPQGVVVCTVPG